MSIWTSPETPEIYSIEGKDGRAMSMVFLPNNETMIWYINPENKTVEGVLTKMRGVYGTHYFWRLWHIDGPGITFGYRILPSDTEPVYMEITVLEKYLEGTGMSTFPVKGARKHELILFGENQIKFQNMWLTKDADDPEAVKILLEMLRNDNEK